MACSTMTIPSSSPTAASAKGIFKEQTGLRRSSSYNDFCCNRSRTGIRRSYSDNHLCYSINSVRAASVQTQPKSSRSGIFPFQLPGSIIPNSVRSFLFDPETSKDMDIVERDVNMETVAPEKTVGEEEEEDEKVKRANWVERLYEIGSQWKKRQQKQDTEGGEIFNADTDGECDCSDEGLCVADYNSDEVVESGGEVTYDRETFSRLLTRVPWSDIKLFSMLAFLCNMAYVIPEIKAIDLRRYYGLHFVTSSLEKKAEAIALQTTIDEDSIRIPEAATETIPVKTVEPEKKRPIRSSAAYEIAASAASYVQKRAKGLASRGTELQRKGDCTDSCIKEEGEGSYQQHKSEVAAQVATTTMTAMVAAGEKEKQEAARDLQSLHSSPCEWFICDDLSTYTRCFVIQGSDSLASWQANLLFEPTEFEGTGVLVHRGIYEAAKGIYEQFMPEIVEHLNTYGERAKLQFTGHSLGGSLSLLINLMLLTRKVVKPSTLRPVVTFGSPFVFCGGHKILNDLGLDDSHIQSVVMHRDIVPRAFSCNYPNHVAVLLKRLNSSFQSHPCLLKNKMLYSPIGKIFILQPDEKSSPPHPLLPTGSALYTLDKAQYGFKNSALKAFLNNPHPLDTLSDPTAYGSDGTILRDHDSSNYLKAVNGVLRQNTKIISRKVRRERNELWPLLNSPSPHLWNHETTLERSVIITRKVMTGV